jgi:hypothetical protein
MDTVTYPETRVAEFIANHFVPARVQVKQSPRLVEEYLVSWTPNVVIADGEDHVHYRVEGYLSPTEFIARLSLGLGKFWLNAKQFEDARGRFEEVAQRHPGTEAGAEALYWLGVVQYKLSHDPAELRAGWRRLTSEYAASEWARRTKIPATS